MLSNSAALCIITALFLLDFCLFWRLFFSALDHGAEGNRNIKDFEYGKEQRILWLAESHTTSVNFQ